MEPSEHVQALQQAESSVVEFLRLPLVMRRTGLARSTIYRMVAAQTFPCPVRLGGRAVGWRLADLDRWSDSRPPAGH
ncbi:MAG: AlpA family phage regulatory protein [Caldimonas sp.]